MKTHLNRKLRLEQQMMDLLRGRDLNNDASRAELYLLSKPIVLEIRCLKVNVEWAQKEIEGLLVRIRADASGRCETLIGRFENDLRNTKGWDWSCLEAILNDIYQSMQKGGGPPAEDYSERVRSIHKETLRQIGECYVRHGIPDPESDRQ